MIKKNRPVHHLSPAHKKAISEGVKRYWQNYKRQETEQFLYRSEIARRKAASKKTGKKYESPKPVSKPVYKHRKVIVYEIVPQLLERKPELKKRKAEARKELKKAKLVEKKLAKLQARREKARLRRLEKKRLLKETPKDVAVIDKAEVKKIEKEVEIKQLSNKAKLAEEKLAKLQARRAKDKARRLAKKRLLEETPKDVAVIDKAEVKAIEKEVEVPTLQIPKESPSQQEIKRLKDKIKELEDEAAREKQKAIDDAIEEERKAIANAIEEEKKQKELDKYEEEYLEHRAEYLKEIEDNQTAALFFDQNQMFATGIRAFNFVETKEEFHNQEALLNDAAIVDLDAVQLYMAWLYA